MKKAANPIDDSLHQKILRYFASGRHMFVGCDDTQSLSALVSSFEISPKIEPLSTIDASGAASLVSFAQTFMESCSYLVHSIGSDLPVKSQSLAGYLSNIQQCFREEQRQGFIVINNIDCILEMQRTIEIEGPFREVMQFYDDVAIAWLGSRDWIVRIQQYDRPFYLSHRTFWL